MTRSKSSGDLGTRKDRAELPARKEPYWLVLEQGRALGYAKGAKGGTWIARYYDPAARPVRAKKALGAADDVSDADGKMVLSWKQAQDAAREWFKTAYMERPLIVRKEPTNHAREKGLRAGKDYNLKSWQPYAQIDVPYGWHFQAG